MENETSIEPIDIPVQDYEVIAATLGRTQTLRLVQALIAELGIRRGIRVLDLGCGCGGDPWLISRTTDAWVVGVDRSTPMLAQAAEVLPVVRADVTAVPIRSRSFDCIYATNLLQLLSDRGVFFAEVSRLITPGGGLGLPVTIPSQVRQRFLNRFFPNLPEIEGRRYPSVDVLRSELHAAGFDTVIVKSLDLGWFRVDRAYIERLRTGIFSGLLLLNDAERQAGLAALEAAVERWERAGTLPKIRWRRTLLVARMLTEIAR